MPIKLPTVQTGYEKSVAEAAKKVGKNLRINMGPGAKSVESLSRPLGRLTGRADEFTKSMEAANARVLAFGASVGVIAAVSNGLKQLVTVTIQVEKSLANINSILKQSESQLESFKNTIFDVARNTEQTFDTVAEAALELSRQGLKAEEVTKRLNDALILSRLSGLSAADSVAGLTAAINSFSSAGITSAEVLNKISAAAASAAVSDRDLIEGLKRSGSVAVASGVKFDELIGIISALQEKTSRGGAVIGNSLKTIFTRIQDVEKLKSLQNLGVDITDLEGRVLSSNKVIENLAPTFAKLDQATRVNLADNLVGKFQIAPFLALLEDYNLRISRSGEVANTSLNATSEAYQRNEALSQTLATAVNSASVNLKELANSLGEIGVTDSFQNIIGVFNSVVSTIQDVLDGDGIGSKFAKGLIKGISSIITGPGLALALLAIGKLLLDFAKFGGGALKTFFGLNKAAEAQAALQGQIAASLLNDKGIRDAILSIEKQNISAGEKKKLQTQFFTKALNEQLMLMQKMQGIAMTVAPGVMKSVPSFMTSKKPFSGKKAAEGFLPIGAESSDISRGVGGAPASAKPVVIPNFAFGGGKRGAMVANSSEYIVPNYANGGDAIFNQNMASSMGLPSNARKVRAASGYIPNFALPKNMTMSDIKSKISGKGFQKRLADGKLTKEDKAILAQQDKLGAAAVGKRSYMANSNPKSILLVPSPQVPFNLDGADHPFQSPYASKLNGKIDFFEGAAAGIDPDLKNSKSADSRKLSGLVDLDDKIAENLAKGVNNVFAEFKDSVGFKTDPDVVTKNNIKKTMESGGPGAFGAIKGATFEALMQAISGGVSQKATKGGGELDVVFSRDKSSLLETVFGIGGKGYKFADFKNSLGQKGKFVRQVIDNVKGKINVSKKAKFSTSGKIKNAASGYIPNFADPLQDAIGREQSAGLPVSQIRINQSGKLRNSQNPMGLAVTNTRDEPTGAIPAARGFIPNFFGLEQARQNLSDKQIAAGFGGQKAKSELTKLADSAGKSSKAITKNTQSVSKHSSTSDGLTNKFFAVQGAMTIFGSVMGEAGGALGEFTQAAMMSAQIMLGMQAFGFSPGLSLGSKSAAGIKASNVALNTQRFSAGGGGKASQLFSKLGPISRGFGKMGPFLGKVVAGFGRFVPILGTVLTLFPLINMGFKKLFGEGIFTKLGKVFGFIETPAERASKALGELADQTLKNLKPGATPFRDFQFTLEKQLAKDSGVRNVTGDENKQEFLLKKVASGFLNLGVLKGQERQIETFKNVQRPKTEVLESGRVITNGTETVKVKDDTVLQGTSRFRINGVEDSKIQEEAQKVRTNLLGALLATLNEEEFAALFKKGDEKEIGKKAQEIFESFSKGTQKQIIDNAVDIVASNVGGPDAQDFTRLKGTKALADILQGKREGNEAEAKDDRRRNPIFDQAFLNQLKAEKQMRELINKNEKRFFADSKAFHTQSLELSKKINLSREDRAEQEGKIAKQLELQQKRQSDSQSALKDFDKDLRELAKDKIFKGGEEKFLENVLSKVSTFNLETDEGLKKLEEFRRKLSSDDNEDFFKDLGLGAENFVEKIETLSPALDALAQSLTLSKTEGETFFSQAIKFLTRAKELATAGRKRSATENFNEFLSSEGLSSSRAKEDADMAALTPEQLNINRRLSVLSQPVLNQTEMGGVRVAAESNQLQRQNELLEIEKQKTKLQTQQQRVVEDFFIKKEGLTKLNAREIEQQLKTLDITNFLAGLNDKELDIIHNKQSASKIEISQLEEKLALTGQTLSQEEKILEEIKKRGPLGFGMVTGFAQNVTDAESNAVNLGKMLGDASAKFAFNIGNAMLDAIQKGEDLGDILIGVASEFLNTISRGFMQSAVNDVLGSFGIGQQKQGGGPIRGGSGTKDDVPAMLMGGEFVMNKKAVRKYGVGFMSSLNSGSMQGFRSGGQVRDREGMFTTPGMNGAGAIVGAGNLLSFATQTPIAMGRDTLTSNGAFLDPESGRLSMFGKRNSPQFQQVQGAKQQAFDLYASQVAAEEQAIRQKKESKKQLMKSLAAAAASVVVGAGVKSMTAGFKAGFSGTDGSFGTKFGAGVKGSLFGGNNIAGESFGGLRNLFTGRGFQSGPSKGVIVPDDEALSFLSQGLRGANLNDNMTLLPELGTYPLNSATGGLIPAAGGVDTVPAMLSGGEFVMNAAATRNIGAGNLQALNSGAGTGDNTNLVAKLDELIIATETSQSTGDINITINGSNGAETETQGQNSTDQQKALSDKIKTAVKQVIADEKRLGGQLRR